jgi:hypothetical protein
LTILLCFEENRMTRVIFLGILCVLLIGCGSLYEKGFQEGLAAGRQYSAPTSVPAPPAAAPAAQTDTNLMYGQTKGHVRMILGQPHTVTGTEADLFWWYYVSDQEMFYILNFQHGIYVEAFKGTRQEILELLQQPREERKNFQWQ